MIEKEKVKGLVDQWLADKEYFLTDISVAPDNRIVVEIDHKEGVWIEDCVELSKFIESNLDREVEDYELEVGSAGIGQPFKVYEQYVSNVGQEVDCLTADGHKIKGVLQSVTPEGIVLLVKEKVTPEGAKRPKLMDVEHPLTFQEIKEVRVVIKF